MDSSTEEIRRRADLVEIVGQYVALRSAGNDRWKACCPFHDEKTPSFYVTREKGFYKCFGCGVSGDVFKFVQQIENITFPEAKRQLAERYGISLGNGGKDLTPEQQAAYAERDRLFRVTAAATAWFRDQFAGNGGLAARDYARRRGLSAKTLERFSIGYAPDAWDSLRQFLVHKYGFKVEDCVAAGLLIERENEDGSVRHYDRYRHRLMFPIWDERGHVIAFGGRALEGGRTGTPEAKYINSPEGPLFKKNRTLYAWHIARPEVGRRESIIVTEGYMDAIALHEAGFSNTVATLGTALTTQHVTMLKRLDPKVVYLCYDGDSAGMQAALRTAPLFDANGLTVRVVSLPDQHDPDTFIREHGEVGFENALRSARLLSQYRVEMAVADFNFENVVERAEAVKAAAEIIAEIPNATQRLAYIDRLRDRWAVAENVTDPARLLMIHASITNQIDAIIKSRQAGRQERERPQEYRESRGNRGKREVVRPGERTADSAGDVEVIGETLKENSSGVPKGVAEAERFLLCSLLTNTTWRSRIIDGLAPTEWTQETHFEIVNALRPLDPELPIDPVALLETLSPEAGGLVSDLVLSDEAQTAISVEVVDDCIRRVRNYWAHQREREILDLVRGKLERNEPITPEERATYVSALMETKRKAPLEAK